MPCLARLLGCYEAIAVPNRRGWDSSYGASERGRRKDLHICGRQGSGVGGGLKRLMVEMPCWDSDRAGRLGVLRLRLCFALAKHNLRSG